jgi:DNA-directed RNA polymerase subunit RPC12/RpoP
MRFARILRPVPPQHIDPDHYHWDQTAYSIKIIAKAEEAKMPSIPSLTEQECTRCGSKLIDPEWNERVNAREVHYLWRCWNCSNEFVTLVASDEEPTSNAEVTKPFFTSLVVE